MAAWTAALPYASIAAGGRLLLLAVSFALQLPSEDGAASLELLDLSVRHLAYAFALSSDKHHLLWHHASLLAASPLTTSLLFLAGCALLDTLLSLPAAGATALLRVRADRIPSPPQRLAAACALAVAISLLRSLLHAAAAHPPPARAAILAASACLPLLLARTVRRGAPLRRGQLHDAVVSLAARVGVRARSVVIGHGGVVGGSVAVDGGLLASGRDDLAMAVVAHELAHAALWHHALGGLLLSLAAGGLALLFVRVVGDGGLLAAFGFPAGVQADVARVALALHVIAPAEIVLRAAAGAVRRWFTFRADAFAADLCFTSQLCEALRVGAKGGEEEKELGDLNLMEKLWHRPVPSAEGRIDRLRGQQLLPAGKKSR